MIIIYTQELEKAIHFAVCLGGITHNGKLIKANGLREYEEEIKEAAKASGYIRTSIGSNPAVAVWGANMVLPYKISDYEGISLEEGFSVPEVKFKARPEFEAQLNVIKGIFNNAEHEEIYDASLGPKGRTDFACLYQYTGSKKTVRRINFKSLQKDDVEMAFRSPVPIAETYKDTLRDNAYIYTYYIANNNLPLILEKTLPKPFPKTKELPVLEYIIKRHKEIQQAELENYFLLGLQATTASGEKFVLSCRTAKFKTRDEAYQFANSLPAEAGLCMEESIDEQLPKGPHSADSIEKEAETLYKYSKTKTRLVLSKLHTEGFITSANTKSRKFADSSEPEVQQLIKRLEKTKAFKDILSNVKDRHIPEEFFAEDRRNGILITKKLPDESFYDMERRNIYYLICKELIKPVMGPRVVKKRKASFKYGDFTFSNTGIEVLEEGYSVLDDMKVPRNNVPYDITTGSMVQLNYMIESKNTNLPVHRKENEVIEFFTSDKSLLPFTPEEIRTTLDSLERRQLIIRKNSTILPTEHCLSVMDFLSKFDGLIDSSLAWEGSLLQIANEKTSIEDAESLGVNLRLAVQQAIRKWHQEADEIVGKLVGISCPICGSPLYSNSKGLSCRKCTYDVEREYLGKILLDQDFAALMKFGTTAMLSGFNIDEGREAMGRVYFNEDKKLCFTLDSQNACPVCGTKFRVKDGAYVCPSCSYKLEREVLHHRFTKKEFEQLLSTRRTNLIAELVDSQGEIFDGVLYLDKDDRYKLKCIKIAAEPAAK